MVDQLDDSGRQFDQIDDGVGDDWTRNGAAVGGGDSESGGFGSCSN